MADSKLADLTADTTPADTDLLYVVADPAGTPADRKSTIAEVVTAMVLDEDNMASDSATKVPTQQSVKAYADTKAAKTTVTVTDVAGTSDTIAAGDLGKILRYTDAGLVTVTLPDGIAVGSIVNLLFWGAAGGAIQDNGTSTVQPEGSVAQYGEVSCVVVATNTWSVQGAVA